jgi:uncharacterized protein Smg (DUF494 family)
MKIILPLILSTLIISSTSLAASCNSEIENSFNTLPDWLTEKREIKENQVDQICIEKALDIYYSWTVGVATKRKNNNQRVVGQFTYCTDEDSSTPLRSEQPICKSKTYLNVLQNSYNDVMDCFGLEPKLFYPLIALESGFHTNSLSVIGEDIGIGQMTPIAIEYVNNNWQDLFETLIVQNDKNSCKRIQQIVNSKDISEIREQHVCSLSSFSKNPIKNLIYMGFLTSLNKKQIIRYFDNNKIADRISNLTQNKLSTNDLDKIINMVTFLSYNTGASSAIASFKTFLNEKSSNFLANKTELDDLIEQNRIQYLMAMDYRSDNFIKDYQKMLKEHNILSKDIDKLELENQINKIKLSDFSINDKEGTFGDFLLKNKISFYLNFLKDRKLYIDNELKVPAGFCSTQDYLEM